MGRGRVELAKGTRREVNEGGRELNKYKGDEEGTGYPRCEMRKVLRHKEAQFMNYRERQHKAEGAHQSHDRTHLTAGEAAYS